MEAICSQELKKLPLPVMTGVLASKVRDAVVRYEEGSSAYREKLRDVLLRVRADLALIGAEIDSGLDIGPDED